MRWRLKRRYATQGGCGTRFPWAESLTATVNLSLRDYGKAGEDDSSFISWLAAFYSQKEVLQTQSAEFQFGANF